MEKGSSTIESPSPIQSISVLEMPEDAKEPIDDEEESETEEPRELTAAEKMKQFRNRHKLRRQRGTELQQIDVDDMLNMQG